VNLLGTLEKPGVNEATAFNYIPAGGFTNPTINKTVSCAKYGGVYDSDCQGDKYEACVMASECGAVHTCSGDPAKQLGLARFLECFEHEHDANMAFADACATRGGFDVAKVRSCFDETETKEATWRALQSSVAAELPGLLCFPWVSVGGVVVSKGGVPGCFGPDPLTKPLLPYICESAAASGTAIAACSDLVTAQ